MLWTLSVALAAPDISVGVGASVGTATQGGALSARLRWESGFQLGLSGSGDRVTTGFIDGYRVRRGVAGTGLVTATLPLVRADRVKVDLELDVGARRLVAQDTDAPDSASWILLTDVRPMVTVPLTPSTAVRLGWTNLLHQQLAPSADLDALGGVLRGQLVVATSDDLQWVVGGDAGGLFGYGGDGGKFLASAHTTLRWVPGAARSWTNH